MNRKRIRRYWADEGLTRPARTRKRQRIGPQRGDRLTATRPDQVWALDFQVDFTADGRQIRFCNVVDEFTREALATAAARSFTADDTTILLDKLIDETGRWPANLRMDNGPELTAVAMRDWCRFAGVATAFIEPGSPWQNGYSESFNGRFRDEFLTTDSSTPCWKPRSWPKTGGPSTTPFDPMDHWAASPRPGFVNNGSTNQHSHDHWTTKRGPVTCASSTWR